jgi:hypothetical protein
MIATPSRPHRPLAIALVLAALHGCALAPIAENVRDDDDDGWFTNATNQAIVLTLVSGAFPLPGQYRVVFDEVRFPLSPALDATIAVGPANVGTPMALGLPVATRTIGTNLLQLPEQRATFRAAVVVQRVTAGVPVDVGAGTVEWQNREAAFSVTLGSATLDFAATLSQFADPTPDSADGDSDGDGIGERDEAQLSAGFDGIGDPRPGRADLFMIVGHTHASSALSASSRELLRSRFAERGIAMHIDDGQLNGKSGVGGLMTGTGGSAVGDGTNVTLAQARTLRDLNVTVGNRRTFAYFALLTRDQVECNGLAFGCAEFPGNSRGNVLVALSKLLDWMPDIKAYQAGVLMHELGHNLGLCHPLATSCGTGVLPAAEQNAGTTIMGTPAENPPIDVWGVPLPNPLVLVNAMTRPLDYSPTQWSNMQLGAGLGQ